MYMYIEIKFVIDMQKSYQRHPAMLLPSVICNIILTGVKPHLTHPAYRYRSTAIVQERFFETSLA